MDGTGRSAGVATAVYASYVVRVWRLRPDGLPTRVDVEHIQSGHHRAVDIDAFADLVARLAAPFPTGPAPPDDPA